jgi:hypothetical protein
MGLVQESTKTIKLIDPRDLTESGSLHQVYSVFCVSASVIANIAPRRYLFPAKAIGSTENIAFKGANCFQGQGMLVRSYSRKQRQMSIQSMDSYFVGPCETLRRIESVDSDLKHIDNVLHYYQDAQHTEHGHEYYSPIPIYIHSIEKTISVPKSMVTDSPIEFGLYIEQTFNLTSTPLFFILDFDDNLVQIEPNELVDHQHAYIVSSDIQ